eukprot:7437664-Heterocapsa_arctica.AAC.1
MPHGGGEVVRIRLQTDAFDISLLADSLGIRVGNCGEAVLLVGDRGYLGKLRSELLDLIVLLHASALSEILSHLQISSHLTQFIAGILVIRLF